MNKNIILESWKKKKVFFSFGPLLYTYLNKNKLFILFKIKKLLFFLYLI